MKVFFFKKFSPNRPRHDHHPAAQHHRPGTITTPPTHYLLPGPGAITTLPPSTTGPGSHHGVASLRFYFERPPKLNSTGLSK